MNTKISYAVSALLLAVAIPATAAECDMLTYQKVISACYTGRANGFDLPENSAFSVYGSYLTTSWDLGPYDADYQGLAFTPSGSTLNSSLSILPPYMWGAIGQRCDIDFNPDTHAQCAANIEQQLADPIKNARYAANQFYWKKHGHNCHDAAEDIGMCLLNAAVYMSASCGMDARVVVWDSEPDINKALGNVYHSQVLVQRVRENSETKTQEPVVCLTESQMAYPSGAIDNGCCSTNLSLLQGGTIEDYATAFKSCPELYVSSYAYPHIYNLETFRMQRQTGEMDSPTRYDRSAGVRSLSQPRAHILAHANALPPQPRITGAAYDKHGVPLALNVR